MDERQQKQVNEAAEKFAEAIKESYQALTQESVNAHMDFLNSVFARPREGTQTARRATREANPERNAESGGEEDATQDEAVRHPLSSWV